MPSSFVKDPHKAGGFSPDSSLTSASVPSFRFKMGTIAFAIGFSIMMVLDVALG